MASTTTIFDSENNVAINYFQASIELCREYCLEYIDNQDDSDTMFQFIERVADEFRTHLTDPQLKHNVLTLCFFILGRDVTDSNLSGVPCKWLMRPMPSNEELAKRVRNYLKDCNCTSDSVVHASSDAYKNYCGSTLFKYVKHALDISTDENNVVEHIHYVICVMQLVRIAKFLSDFDDHYFELSLHPFDMCLIAKKAIVLKAASTRVRDESIAAFEKTISRCVDTEVIMDDVDLFAQINGVISAYNSSYLTASQRDKVRTMFNQVIGCNLTHDNIIACYENDEQPLREYMTTLKDKLASISSSLEYVTSCAHILNDGFKNAFLQNTSAITTGSTTICSRAKYYMTTVQTIIHIAEYLTKREFVGGVHPFVNCLD